MSASPTQRTQAYLKERGYVVANCERKVPCTPKGFRGLLKTQDLFGFVDTQALNPRTWDALLCIQSTTGDHHGHRREKILASDITPTLLRHARIELWSWSKRGARGKRKLWTLRRERFGFGLEASAGRPATVISFETETHLDEI